MLKGAGIDLEIESDRIILKHSKKRIINPFNIKIPGDISSAAFFITAALTAEEGELLLKNVGINYSRSGFLEVVEDMGGDIELLNVREEGGEPTADILVRASQLKATEISGDIIPRLIDEIPAIAVLAASAEGETVIRDAVELRVKETDRISAVVNEFKKLGISIEEFEDGMAVDGPAHILGGKILESYHDHRIAMSLAVLALKAESAVTISGSEIINTSFPGFAELLKSI